MVADGKSEQLCLNSMLECLEPMTKVTRIETNCQQTATIDLLAGRKDPMETSSVLDKDECLATAKKTASCDSEQSAKGRLLKPSGIAKRS